MLVFKVFMYALKYLAILWIASYNIFFYLKEKFVVKTPTKK